MYPLMTSVCVFVDDIHGGLATLQSSIGVIDQRPQAFRSGPGISAVSCRVYPKYAVAPTVIQLVADATDDQKSDDFGIGGEHQTTTAVFPLSEIAARQGTRLIKWHATELAMSDEDVASLADHLAGLGVEVGYNPPDRRDSFYVAGNPASASFDPTIDGGLFLEATKLIGLGVPETALTEPADVPPAASPDAMVRVVAREYLVDDLDAVLSALESSLRWAPASVTDEGEVRRAVMPFSAPRSARLELVEATGPGPIADAVAEFGAGAWTVRISVVDVDAKAMDLAARGTPFTLTDGALRPDPSSTLNVPFEFVTALRR